MRKVKPGREEEEESGWKCSLTVSSRPVSSQEQCLPVLRHPYWVGLARPVHGVAKSRTRLNDFTFTFHFHALEKEMATHSSVLAWRIPGVGEPDGLLSMGLHRVGYD